MAPAALRGQALAYSILLLGVGGLLSPLLAVPGTRASRSVGEDALLAELPPVVAQPAPPPYA